MNRKVDKYILLGLMSIAMFLLSSCEDEQMRPYIKEASLSTEHLQFDVQANKMEVEIISEEIWKVIVPENSWCKVEPLEGKGNGRFTVSVDPNLMAIERKLDLLVVGSYLVIPDTLAVVQEQMTPEKESALKYSFRQFKQITEDTINYNVKVQGVVTTDSLHANYDARELFLEEHTDEGVEVLHIRFNEAHSYTRGDVIDVWILGGVKSYSRGVTSVTINETDRSEKTGEQQLSIPKITLLEAMQGGYTGRLVDIEGVQFKDENITYGSARHFLIRDDHSMARAYAVIDENAKFRDQMIATGNGTVRGIITPYTMANEWHIGVQIDHIQDLPNPKGKFKDGSIVFWNFKNAANYLAPNSGMMKEVSRFSVTATEDVKYIALDGGDGMKPAAGVKTGCIDAGIFHTGDYWLIETSFKGVTGDVQLDFSLRGYGGLYLKKWPIEWTADTTVSQWTPIASVDPLNSGTIPFRTSLLIQNATNHDKVFIRFVCPGDKDDTTDKLRRSSVGFVRMTEVVIPKFELH